MKNYLTKLEKEENLLDRIEKQRIRISKLRTKERDYKTFVEKLGAKELSELDPDEIRLKLNQIMDWNEDEKNKADLIAKKKIK